MSTYCFRIFVRDPDFRNKYREHAKLHNDRLRTDPLMDSGFDLYCPTQLAATAGSLLSIDLGIVGVMYRDGRAVAYTTEPRSSICNTPLRLANSRGIIDAGYRGNLIGKFDVQRDCYKIEPGTRLLQVLTPTLEPFPVEIVDTLEQLGTSIRGERGFGSTGGHAGAS
jgi:dUTP pyrophosphatase